MSTQQPSGPFSFAAGEARIVADAVLILTATGDEALHSGQWVALQAAARLQKAGLTVVHHQQSQGLSAHLANLTEEAGVDVFSHGGEDRLVHAEAAQHEVILDAGNVACLKDRWAYAFACRAGVELAGHAVAAGCRCFVGYEASLILEWAPGDIPEEIREAFAAFVCEALLSVAQGQRREVTLKRHLLALAAPLELWCDEHPERAGGLGITIQQLYGRLVLRV